MNWEALGAIGEILGAVTVLITLAYLAAQVRQNIYSVSASIYEAAMSSLNEVNSFVGINAEPSSIVRRGNVDPESLTQGRDVPIQFQGSFRRGQPD